MKNTTLKLAALFCCLLLLVSIGFAEKAKKMPLQDSPAKEKAKEPLKSEKEQPQQAGQAQTTDRKAQPLSDVQPAEPQPTPAQPASGIQPAQLPQPETQPAPVFWDKGRNIKWQVFSGGGSNSTASKGHRMLNVVYQTAIGYANSASHQALQGFLMGGEAEGFLRGDANNDGFVNLGDAIYILNYLFKHGPAPIPMDAGDANCDGATELGDAIYILNYLFKNGPPPGC